MDPFDEFEFKPLTEGLGFHKKKSEAKASTTTREPLIKDQGLSLLEEEALIPPLPRKNKPATKSTKISPMVEEPTTTAVDEILKNLQKNRHFDIAESKESLKNAKPKEEYILSNWSFSSTFLDTMLVVASSLLCMIILLVVTRVDLIANLTRPDSQGMIYLATVGLFFCVNFIYMVVNRAFLGCSPGEWAFDQRIGRPEEMSQALYPVRVAARTILVMATGFILFPVLSLIMGKDVVGSLTNTSLYKKV